jgi:hypothetical protein
MYPTGKELKNITGVFAAQLQYKSDGGIDHFGDTIVGMFEVFSFAGCFSTQFCLFCRGYINALSAVAGLCSLQIFIYRGNVNDKCH